jgi:hypothetical protein
MERGHSCPHVCASKRIVPKMNKSRISIKCFAFPTRADKSVRVPFGDKFYCYIYFSKTIKAR